MKGWRGTLTELIYAGLLWLGQKVEDFILQLGT